MFIVSETRETLRVLTGAVFHVTLHLYHANAVHDGSTKLVLNGTVLLLQDDVQSAAAGTGLRGARSTSLAEIVQVAEGDALTIHSSGAAAPVGSLVMVQL